MGEENSKRIACAGEEGPLGHPKVYLEFNSEGKATCPYCGKSFSIEELDDNSAVNTPN